MGAVDGRTNVWSYRYETLSLSAIVNRGVVSRSVSVRQQHLRIYERYFRASLPAGLQEFTNYLRKEYSHENIRFWLAVKDLRHSFQAQIPDKVNEIFRYENTTRVPRDIFFFR